MKTTLKRICLLAFALLALLIVSCGNSPASATSGSTPTPQATHPPTPTPTPQAKTAADIVTALKAAGLPVGTSFTYTADNDENHLLGRPGQYVSKANWIDTRLQTTDTGADISVRDGGSIETFANPTDAKNRFTYIQAISKSGGALFAEYEYLSGLYILRVSSTLTPTQAKAYQTAFENIVK